MYYGEKFNSITHLAGAALAIGGAAVLITVGARLGDPWKIVSFSIYGAMLFLLYAISALYHSLRGKAKNVFQKLDHCAIYLLIAGSYTPFTLVTLREHSGWIIFGLEWGLAVIGIVQEILFAKGARWLSLAIYVMMGWLAIAVIVGFVYGGTLLSGILPQLHSCVSWEGHLCGAVAGGIVAYVLAR